MDDGRSLPSVAWTMDETKKMKDKKIILPFNITIINNTVGHGPCVAGLKPGNSLNFSGHARADNGSGSFDKLRMMVSGVEPMPEPYEIYLIRQLETDDYYGV